MIDNKVRKLISSSQLYYIMSQTERNYFAPSQDLEQAHMLLELIEPGRQEDYVDILTEVLFQRVLRVGSWTILTASPRELTEAFVKLYEIPD